MATPQQIPDKPAYKSSEVCQYTDTQPYVLRFWESEFPQLNPERSGGGKPVYSRRDIDVVMRIKQLLYEEEYTLDDARRRLENELQRRGGDRLPDAAPPERQAAPPREKPAEEKAKPVREGNGGTPVGERRPAFDSVDRERYEDAIDEIAHLRLQLKEAETQLRRAEQATRQSEQVADRDRRRCARAIERLEELLEMVS